MINSPAAFRILSGTTGIAFILSGLVLTASFFGYQQPGTTPSIPTGPVGHYFVAFAGCALVGWGGALLGAARNPGANRAIALASAAALVLMGVVRMVAWVIGDYYVWLGHIPRAEAAFFLCLALGFIWFQPPAATLEDSK